MDYPTPDNPWEDLLRGIINANFCVYLIQNRWVLFFTKQNYIKNNLHQWTQTYIFISKELFTDAEGAGHLCPINRYNL